MNGCAYTGLIFTEDDVLEDVLEDVLKDVRFFDQCNTFSMHLTFI